MAAVCLAAGGKADAAGNGDFGELLSIARAEVPGGRMLDAVSSSGGREIDMLFQDVDGNLISVTVDVETRNVVQITGGDRSPPQYGVSPVPLGAPPEDNGPAVVSPWPGNDGPEAGGAGAGPSGGGASGSGSQGSTDGGSKGGGDKGGGGKGGGDKGGGDKGGGGNGGGGKGGK